MNYRELVVASTMVLIGIVPSVASSQGPERQARVALGVPAGTHGVRSVSWIGLARDGSAVVSGSGDNVIAVVAPNGNIRAKLTGRDIGLTVGLPRIGILGDSMWVRAPVAEALHWFTFDGKTRGTTPAALALLWPNGDPTPFGAAGSMMGPSLTGFLDGGGRTYDVFVPQGVTTPPEWRRPQGATAATLVVADNGIVKSFIRWRSANGRCYVSGTLLPFCQLVLTATSQDNRLFGTADAYTAGADSGKILAVVQKATGDTAFVARLPFRAVAVASREMDSVVAEMEARVKAGTATEQRLAAIKGAKPTVHAPVRSVMFSMDGAMWIGVYDGHPERRYLVVGPEGAMRYTVVVPEGIQVLAAREGEAWGIVDRGSDRGAIVRLTF